MNDEPLYFKRSDLNKWAGDNGDIVRAFEALVSRVIANTNALKTPLPIGFVYVQLPDQPEPSTFGGKWLNVTALYEGAFFRAEGGKASAFESGVQNHQLEDHIHDSNAMNVGGSGGSVMAGANYVRTFTQTSIPITGNHGDETRPTNYTIRLWQRYE